MDRQVKVRVDFSAGGNAKEYAKELGRSSQQLGKFIEANTLSFKNLGRVAAESIKSPQGFAGASKGIGDALAKARQYMTSGPAAIPMTPAWARFIQGNTFNPVTAAQRSAQALQGFAGANMPGALQTGRTLPTGAIPFAKQTYDIADDLKKFSLNLGIATGAVGAFAAAAGPAVSQTFFGSLRLAAGEIGILFIPAITKAAGVLQNVASFIQEFKPIGQVLGAVALPATFLALGGAVVFAGKVIWNLAAAAANAANALNAKMGVGGTLGPGRVLAGVGIATAGSLASQLVGGAVGGQTGGYISSVGSGASYGAALGTAIPLLGPGISTIVGGVLGAAGGAIWEYFSSKGKTATSFDFTAGGGRDITDLVEQVQREAIRDPMQQMQAEQQARALEELARQIGYLSQRIGIQPWQVGT